MLTEAWMGLGIEAETILAPGGRGETGGLRPTPDPDYLKSQGDSRNAQQPPDNGEGGLWWRMRSRAILCHRSTRDAFYYDIPAKGQRG